MFAALAAVNVWATASITWSLGGAFDYAPASGVWVDTSEGGEQIMKGHLYLCFTTPGSGEDMILQLTKPFADGGLEDAGVDAMTTFLEANSQWNGYNANNPNFSANCYEQTGGAFGTCPYPGQESPSLVTIDGIDQNKAYDVAAIIFDTRDITADSKYVVIKGYGEQDFYMDSDKGQLEVGFGTEWNDGDDYTVYATNDDAEDAQNHESGMELSVDEGEDDVTYYIVATTYENESPESYIFKVFGKEGKGPVTGVSRVSNDSNVSVAGANGVISVAGAAEGEIIVVYNVSGAVVAKAVAAEELTTVNVSNSGMYIVCVGNKGYKIAF